MTAEPEGTNWFGIGIGAGALGLVMIAYYAFYWSLLGLWTPGPWMWLSLVALALPLALLAAGIFLLVRRRRLGFVLMGIGLAWLVGLGFNETWALTSALFAQLILGAGVVVAGVGYQATRR